jgi:hypothetical protein
MLQYICSVLLYFHFITTNEAAYRLKICKDYTGKSYTAGNGKIVELSLHAVNFYLNRGVLQSIII